MFCTLSKTVVQRSNASTTETYILPQSTDYSIQVVSNIQPILELWDSLAPQHNIFLHSSYLAALEAYPPAKLGFRYVIFYHNQQPIGIAYMQTYFVKAADSMQNSDEPESTHKRVCLISMLSNSVRTWFLRRSEFHLLINGNILLTGEHGYHFQPHIDAALAIELVRQATDLLPRLIQNETNQKIAITFYKDYEVGKHTHVDDSLRRASFVGFTMQPSMFMNIRPEWKTFDDYLNAMQSKYRVRARRALKKGQEIVKKELSLDEIEQHLPTIHALYKIVAHNAGFNAFILHERYFYGLKEYLGDRFKLVGYFLNGELIAFYTGILSGNELEAHFLGVSDQYNHEYQVYLNILYDLARMGIYYQVGKIDFARTALEIKSSIGAEPREMYCYMRHRSAFSGTMLRLMLNYFNPKEVWQQRHPFKDSPHAEAEEVAAHAS